MSDAYKKAGVDIDAGDRLVRSIGPLIKATQRPGADGTIGGFGGLFDLKAAGYTDPILVSGTDGVGTKLKLAEQTGIHDTIGIDLVAMCVNDILAQGAEPLFFLDYFACGKLNVGVAEDVIAGIAEGCRLAGAALIGGETAEMPGMYEPGTYDLAGFCVGAVDRAHLLPQWTGDGAMQAGDMLIALASSGAHSNGYSLIRKVITDAGLALNAPAPFSPATTIGEAFLTPTRLYVASVLPLLKAGRVKGFAHITGGGLTDNLPRVLPEGLVPQLDETALAFPPMFTWLKEAGGISDEDMRRTFNCGIGAVLVVARSEADSLLADLTAAGESPFLIGNLVSA